MGADSAPSGILAGFVEVEEKGRGKQGEGSVPSLPALGPWAPQLNGPPRYKVFTGFPVHNTLDYVRHSQYSNHVQQ